MSSLIRNYSERNAMLFRIIMPCVKENPVHSDLSQKAISTAIGKGMNDWIGRKGEMIFQDRVAIVTDVSPVFLNLFAP